MNKKNDQVNSTYSFLKKVLIFVSIAVFAILMILFIKRAINTLLVIFAGICLGIVLRGLRDFVHYYMHMSNGFSLVTVLILFFGFVALSGYFLGPVVYQQTQVLSKEIPKDYIMLRKQLSVYRWGRELIRENPRVEDLFKEKGKKKESLTHTVTNILSNFLYLLAALLLVFVTAVYIAAEPELYSEGFVRLFPKKRRTQVAKIMTDISLAIQWWLVGQICSMILLGVITSIGLWLLGVPYALLLGLFTAIMTFIPNLGPIIAAVPTLLFSLTIGVQTAIYVAVFFTILQCIEGYFITPMIHRNAIAVPPMLIITIQFILYYLIGFLALFLAMPLIACGMVLVKELYIRDVLGDPLNEQTDIDMEGGNIFKKE